MTADPVGRIAPAETCAAATVARAADEADDTQAYADLERQLILLFSRARSQVRDRALRVHPELQPMGFKVVSTLVYRGPHHTGALAGLLGTDKSLISRTVRQLIDLGLVHREQDPQDGRAHFLVATEDAVLRVQQVSTADRQNMLDRLHDWDVRDIRTLARLLGRLNELSDPTRDG